MDNNKVIDWLLEEDNYSIRYRTMVDLLDKAIDDQEVIDTYNLIWEQKDITKMLALRDDNNLWDTKKFGGHTSLRYLTAFAEHGVHYDERLDDFIDYSVNFLKGKEETTGVGSYDGCSSALVLRAIVKLGYHDRDDVRDLINKYASTQLYDGGFMCNRVLKKRPERKSCYKAAVAALLLYAECKRKGIDIYNEDKLIDYFLKRDVFYVSDKSRLVIDSREGWRFVDNFFPVEPMRIGLPLTISSLCVLGVGEHEGMQKAWDILEDKKNECNRLSLEGTLSKQPCKFGKIGHENKWMTYYALLAEKYKCS